MKYAKQFNKLTTMAFYVKRKSDNKIFEVWKYIKSSQPDDLREHIWCNDWYGHHIIGGDCIWSSKKEIKFSKYKIEPLVLPYDLIEARKIVLQNYSHDTAKLFWKEITGFTYDTFGKFKGYPQGFFMIKKNNNISCIGAYYTSNTCENNFDLCWINTKKEYRKMGYATAMVKFLENKILSHNYNLGNILLTSENKNVAFYENLGYEVISENGSYLMCKKYN